MDHIFEFLEFFWAGSFGRSLNVASLVLVTKRGGAEDCRLTRVVVVASLVLVPKRGGAEDCRLTRVVVVGGRN